MQLSDNARGIMFMCLAMCAFTINDTAMKLLGQELPLFQTIAFRGLISASALILFALVTGQFTLKFSRSDGYFIGLRCIGEVVATLLFLSALLFMPLANVSAVMQATPLALALAAAVFFGDKIGPRRLIAILIGFAGVMLIVRPGPDGFDFWAGAALFSVIFVVLRDLSTRKVSRNVPSVMIAVTSAFVVTVVGLIGMAIEGWAPMSLLQWGQMLIAGGGVMLGYIFSVLFMRIGDVAVISPFRYTALIWALLLGWVVFGQLPDALTLFGAALVVATGIFTIWREARVKRPKT